jgi:hypothetical protein
MPDRQLFMLARAFPSGVRGPVDFILFKRLAINCFSLTGFLPVVRLGVEVVVSAMIGVGVLVSAMIGVGVLVSAMIGVGVGVIVSAMIESLPV